MAEIQVYTNIRLHVINIYKWLVALVAMLSRSYSVSVPPNNMNILQGKNSDEFNYGCCISLDMCMMEPNWTWQFVHSQGKF